MSSKVMNEVYSNSNMWQSQVEIKDYSQSILTTFLGLKYYNSGMLAS
jgi:hypothetical protein